MSGPVEGLLARVRAIVGTMDVERLDLAPNLARHDDERLQPVEVIRVEERFFVRVREHPNPWWMAELDANGEPVP